MPLAEYLASEQAREDARRADNELNTCTGRFYPISDAWLRSDVVGVWRKVRLERGDSSVSAYYRPDGERYVVTDLGEGVRALRLRTGCSHYEATGDHGT